jgi:hypothetical protein
VVVEIVEVPFSNPPKARTTPVPIQRSAATPHQVSA